MARGVDASRMGFGFLLVGVVAVFLGSTPAYADPPPTYDGVMSFPEIKGPSDPEEFSWQVTLDEGQALEQIDDQTAVVYYESSHHPAFFIEAGHAHDSVGARVPTTLSVSGADLIVLTVHHRAGNSLAGGAPFAYPILAGEGWEGGLSPVEVLGSPDESELLERSEAAAQENAREVNTCVVPRVMTELLSIAKRRLRKAGCRDGQIIERKDSQSGRARVIKQHPRPGALLLPISAVALTVR